MERDFSSEIEVKATRSGGKGGQHVNKVSTRIELTLNIPASLLLTEEEKQILAVKLNLSQDGFLRVVCDETRHQLKNKEIAIQKLNILIAKSLLKPKRRIATKPTRSSKLAKQISKKLHAEKKENRRGSRGLY